MTKDIILLDYDNKQIGHMEKEEAHRRGLLHRAFSVFIIDGNRLLLQVRNRNKYHSGGLIANSCCSHPANGEEISAAATRRVMEELGMSTTLQPIGSFIYRAEFDNGMTEYEHDTVFIGNACGEITPDTEEIESVYYEDIDVIKQQLIICPEKFAVWFITAFPIVLNYLNIN